MDESQTNGAEREAEGDAAVSSPTPQDHGDVLATDSHFPEPEQSNGFLEMHVRTEVPVNHSTTPIGIPERCVNPFALVNGHTSTTGQHLATLLDDEGDTALFYEADPNTQTFDPDQVDDNESIADSIAPSDVNTIQAFAKLEFEDGEFYMTTYAVELGRDIRAAHDQTHSQASSRQADFGITRSRKRSSSDRSDRPRKRRREHRNYTGSVVSESGGIIGVDVPCEERGETAHPTLEKARSLSSSSPYMSRRNSLHAPKKDYNVLTRELEEWLGHGGDEQLPEDPPPPNIDQMPSVDKIPLIPIHPPANANPSDGGHRGISRKHVKIFFNFDLHMFQVIFWGRNGGFVDDTWFASEETVTLVSGSRIQLRGICIRFTLPNVPDGETGAEEADLSEHMTVGNASYDIAYSGESEGIEYPYNVDDGTGVVESEEIEDESEGDLPRNRKAKAKKALKPTPTPRLEPEPPKPKRKGPGRPPKNGIMSKREQAQQAREARENAKAKSEEKSNQTQERSGGKTAKALELEASHLQPNGKRKYTKRKKAVEIEAAHESTEQDDPVPAESATKPAKEKKPIKPPRSPSPVFNEAELTAEQLAKPSSSYVVLIHEALSNSKTGQMSLPQIYRAIERRYPFFKLRVQTSGWQSSVRHNLSQHAAFTKITRDGKGWMWGLVPEVSIEKEKKRRPTPPPAPQHNYQYPPQAQRYPQNSHPYPYPNMPAPIHGTMPFPYTVPPMPYPPPMGTNGIPMPFVKPQAESTYKSPYDSTPDPSQAAPTATPQPSAKTNGVNGHYPTPTSQPPQRSAPIATTPIVLPTANGAQIQQNTPRGAPRYSDEVVAKIKTFKVRLISSLNPNSNPEELVNPVIDHVIYGSPLKAGEGSNERSILTAVENIILSTAPAAPALANSVDTVAEKAADIARSVRDDVSVTDAKK